MVPVLLGGGVAVKLSLGSGAVRGGAVVAVHNLDGLRGHVVLWRFFLGSREDGWDAPVMKEIIQIGRAHV